MHRNVDESKVEPRKNSLRTRKKLSNPMQKPDDTHTGEMTTLEQAEEILGRI